AARPETCDALAALLGCDDGWAAEDPSPAAARGLRLLAAHPAACDAVAGLLGCDDGWAPTGASPSGASSAGASPAGAVLVGRHPATPTAVEALLART
uniref:hypothetical protein n=1 Tax=Streptomyces sp. CRN 30 TaxID=3075613 RepID=UPI002A7EB98B